MSGEVVEDPMDTNQSAYEMDVTDPQVEGTGSHRIDDMMLLEDQGNTPVLEGGNIFFSGKLQNGEDREDDEYSLTVQTQCIDIEQLQCSYAGLAFITRVEFIVAHCPPLRLEAIISYINYIREETQNVVKYLALFKDFESETICNPATSQITAPVFDKKWADETGVAWNNKLDQLQAEYKRHKDEGVKESTRRAMEDLFQHFCKAGQVDEALRLYGRGIRDYCAQLKHSINMWINWIELAIVANEWEKVESMSYQALRTLRDAEEAEKTNNASRNERHSYMIERDAIVQANTVQSNRILIDSALAKVLASQVFIRLRSKNYKQLVEKVLEIQMDHLTPKWFANLSDLGIYALLCSLATMSRDELKKNIVDDGTIKKLLESEPQFIEMLTCFINSQFGRCFTIMRNVKDRLLLDPFISRCVPDLYRLIREKCLIQYLKPYSAIRMDTMCNALGYSRSELEKIILDLVDRGEINVRIDQINGILRAVQNSDQLTTQKKLFGVYDQMICKSHGIMWKAVLAHANISSSYDKEVRGKRKTVKDMVVKSNMENRSPSESISNQSLDGTDDSVLKGRVSQQEGNLALETATEDDNIIVEEPEPLQ